jgi:hypothetical protein
MKDGLEDQAPTFEVVAVLEDYVPTPWNLAQA